MERKGFGNFLTMLGGQLFLMNVKKPAHISILSFKYLSLSPPPPPLSYLPMQGKIFFLVSNFQVQGLGA